MLFFLNWNRIKSFIEKNIFLRRVFFLVIGTIVLYSILNSISFLFIANDMFKEMQVKQLRACSDVIEALMLKYHAGSITESEFNERFSINKTAWNAVIYVYDGNGSLIIKSDVPIEPKPGMKPAMKTGVKPPEMKFGVKPPNMRPGIKPDKEHLQKMASDLHRTLEEYVVPVLNGQHVARTKGHFLVVGEPIIDNGIVLGGILLSKPPEELGTALYGLNQSMLVSALCVLFLMIAPVYHLTRHIVKPLKQMSDVAINMANGILTEKANEELKGEIGELGRSLNYLSARLSQTISTLEVERNRLKQTIDGLSEGIVAVDSMGNVTNANPAIYDILGIVQDEKNMNMVLSEELWKDFHTVLEQGDTVVRNMKWKQMILRITICPLEDEGCNIVGVVGLFRDVTESERLEQTRREYVANVSHELRTPVSALRALAETLADDMIPDEETKQRYYKHMLHEIMRLSRLIDDLLTLSRLQSDKVSIRQKEFQVNEVMETVAERYAVLADEKDIKFDFLPLKEDLWVYNSIDLVEQVLIILLDNSIKYTLAQGHISLYATVSENEIRISVSDTGIGIDVTDLSHIFERFYKSDKAHATKGTGLGLAIAYEIIQQMGEKIYVESEPGKGSIFTFTLSSVSVAIGE